MKTEYFLFSSQHVEKLFISCTVFILTNNSPSINGNPDKTNVFIKIIKGDEMFIMLFYSIVFILYSDNCVTNLHTSFTFLR